MMNVSFITAGIINGVDSIMVAMKVAETSISISDEQRPGMKKDAHSMSIIAGAPSDAIDVVDDKHVDATVIVCPHHFNFLTSVLDSSSSMHYEKEVNDGSSSSICTTQELLFIENNDSTTRRPLLLQQDDDEMDYAPLPSLLHPNMTMIDTFMEHVLLLPDNGNHGHYYGVGNDALHYHLPMMMTCPLIEISSIPLKEEHPISFREEIMTNDMVVEQAAAMTGEEIGISTSVSMMEHHAEDDGSIGHQEHAPTFDLARHQEKKPNEMEMRVDSSFKKSASPMHIDYYPSLSKIQASPTTTSNNDDREEESPISACVNCGALFEIHVMIQGKSRTTPHGRNAILPSASHYWFVSLSEISFHDYDDDDVGALHMEQPLVLRCQSLPRSTIGCNESTSSVHSCHANYEELPFMCQSLARILVPYSLLRRDLNSDMQHEENYPIAYDEKIIQASLTKLPKSMASMGNGKSDFGSGRNNTISVRSIVDQWVVNVAIPMEEAGSSNFRRPFKFQSPIYSIHLNDTMHLDATGSLDRDGYFEWNPTWDNCSSFLLGMTISGIFTLGVFVIVLSFKSIKSKYGGVSEIASLGTISDEPVSDKTPTKSTSFDTERSDASRHSIPSAYENRSPHCFVHHLLNEPEQNSQKSNGRGALSPGEDRDISDCDARTTGTRTTEISSEPSSLSRRGVSIVEFSQASLNIPPRELHRTETDSDNVQDCDSNNSSLNNEFIRGNVVENAARRALDYDADCTPLRSNLFRNQTQVNESSFSQKLGEESKQPQSNEDENALQSIGDHAYHRYTNPQRESLNLNSSRHHEANAAQSNTPIICHDTQHTNDVSQAEIGKKPAPNPVSPPKIMRNNSNDLFSESSSPEMALNTSERYTSQTNQLQKSSNNTQCPISSHFSTSPTSQTAALHMDYQGERYPQSIGNSSFHHSPEEDMFGNIQDETSLATRKVRNECKGISPFPTHQSVSEDISPVPTNYLESEEISPFPTTHSFSSSKNYRSDSITKTSRMRPSINSSEKHETSKHHRHTSTGKVPSPVPDSHTMSPKNLFVPESIHMHQVEAEENPLTQTNSNEDRSALALSLGHQHSTNTAASPQNHTGNSPVTDGWNNVKAVSLHASQSSIPPRHFSYRKTRIVPPNKCPSPTSTVAATAADFIAPRRKNQMPERQLFCRSERPLAIPSGDARQGQRKKFAASVAVVLEPTSLIPGITQMPSSSKRAEEDGSAQSNAESFERGATEFFENESQYLSANLSEDHLRRKICSTKSSSSEKKLLASSKTHATYKPSAVLIPLSDDIEKPVWQFSSPIKSV